MSKGLFGGLFDFDHDGKMNALERAAEFQFFNDVVMAAEDEDALAAAGLDRDDLGWINADERREALKDAGFDHTDFDFDD